MNEKEVSPKLNESDTASDDGIKSVVLQDFTTAREYIKRNYANTWRDCYKCYNNIRTLRGYEGVSDDFVPETFTIVESVKANVFGGKPKFTFVPLREEQKQNTDTLNSLVDYYWSQNDMTQKALDWGHDMLTYGNGIIMASWEGDMVEYKNIPLNDFFVDPTATHMNKPGTAGYPKYAGYRFLTTVDELKSRKIVDPETGDMMELYKNLDEIPQNRPTGDDATDKEIKERLVGSTLDGSASAKQVEVIVYYTRKKKVLIANREVVIYNGKNPYQREGRSVTKSVDLDGSDMSSDVKVPEIKGFLPFAVLRNYVDTSLFFAKGDVEIILARQEALNDVSSQKHDALTYALNPMWQIDPQFKHLADQIESMPGAVLPIPQGAISTFDRQMVGSEADVEMQRIQAEMRRATAADEVVQGSSQQTGRITATEVQTQINQASQRFSSKLTTIESEGMAQLARITFYMIQIFVTQPMAVRVVGPDGVQWKDYDPDEFIDEYEPTVQLASTQKAIKQEEGQKYAMVHQQAANSQFVDQRELMRLYFESMLSLPDSQIKKLLPPNLGTPQPQGGADPAMISALQGAGQGSPAAPVNPAAAPSAPLA